MRISDDHKRSMFCFGGIMRTRLLSFLVLVFAVFPYISASAQPVIQPPGGFGHYCSLKNGAFGWGDINSDPCGSAPESDIAFAGLWDTNGLNRAYVECSDGFTFWAASPSAGEASLRAAFNATTGHPNCKINVAPKNMPVFRHPWSIAVNWMMRTSRGVDLALHGQTFSAADRCKSAGATAYELDNAGHVNWNADASKDSNHSGYDWSIPGNKPGDWSVRSVAAGKVVAARDRVIEGSRAQREIYLRYIVSKSPSSRYREEFIGYYAHLKNIRVKTGDIVKSAQLLGPVGDTGPGGTHLHFSVFRLRNVRGQFKSYHPFGFDTPSLAFIHDAGAEFRTIDPFGWNDASCVDAWGYHADSDRGAPSINLWRSGLAPPGWNHSDH